MTAPYGMQEADWNDPDYICTVWVTPEGYVLGPSIPFGVEAGPGYARLDDMGTLHPCQRREP